MPIAQIGDVLMDDSTTLIFNYINKSKKEIDKHINNFKPFKEKVEVPELADNLNDTIKYFPVFEIYDTLNTKINTNKFKSKFTLVEFWYKSCGPCLANMKELEKVRKRFSTEDLEIIALNLNDSIDDHTKRIITKSKYSYKFYFGDKKNKKNILIRGYPTSFLYMSSNQKIILNHLGGGPDYSKQMINLIENKLKEHDKN
ncbi:MAG: TlpA family protein disulfide reductase [Bacteroidetes bacterium]|nr:TlpA family protein disulfide reductase [Bacteroidota bacterium]